MGLFDQVLAALDNPNQQGSPDQLGGIFNTVQQVSNTQGIDPGTTQTIMSVVGNYVRSALQQKQMMGGNQQAEAIVNQYGGTSPNYGAVESLFTPQQQYQVAEAAAQRTGLNVNLIQSLLPILVPLVLNLLRSGANNQNPNMRGSNSVLNAFLDSNNDGQVDISEAIAVAGRFLRR